MEKIVEDFLALKEPFQNLYYMSEVFDKNKCREFHKEIKKLLLKQDNKNKRYYYLITFTLSDENKDADEVNVYNYIKSRLQRSALQVEKAHLVIEYTKQDRPHYHASVISKKYISKDRFKYYIKKYGFVDISKNHSQNYETMLKYITKSDIPEQIIGDL